MEMVRDGREALLEFVQRSHVALTLADHGRPDTPLVAVNPAFCAMTGYVPDEVLDRNCRFLQPPSGAGPVRERMRTFIRDRAQNDGKFVIANCRRDGTPFVNLVYMAKLRGPHDGDLILGSQFDVSRLGGRDLDLYETALMADITSLTRLCDGEGWYFLGNYDTLASSSALIAQHRLAD